MDRPAGLVAAAGGAREELVPGAEQRALAVDVDLPRLAAGDQLPDRALGHDLLDGREQRRGHPGVQRQRGVAQRVGRAEQQVAVVALGRPAAHPLQQPGPDLQVVGQLLGRLPGVQLDRDGVPPGRPRVAPGVHPERPQPRLVGHHGRRRTGRCRHPIGTIRTCCAAPRLPTFFQTMFAATASWPSRQTVASIGHDLADDGLARMASVTHRGGHVVDTQPAGHRLTPHCAARELQKLPSRPRPPRERVRPVADSSPDGRPRYRRSTRASRDGGVTAAAPARRAVSIRARGQAPIVRPRLDRSRDAFTYRLAGESSPPVHRPRPAARAARAAADPGHQPAVELASADPGPVRRPRPGGLGAVRARPGAAARGDLLGPVRRAGQGRRHRGHRDRAGRRPAAPT